MGVTTTACLLAPLPLPSPAVAASAARGAATCTSGAARRWIRDGTLERAASAGAAVVRRPLRAGWWPDHMDASASLALLADRCGQPGLRSANRSAAERCPPCTATGTS